MQDGIVWRFKTARFEVALEITPEWGYRYDGDDPDGEVQKKLDDGEYVAFDSAVTVTLDGHEIAADYLGGSVYGDDTMDEFWTMHRSPNPMHRNCSIRRAKEPGTTIGHYFPDMVGEAITEARKYVKSMKGKPVLRV